MSTTKSTTEKSKPQQRYFEDPQGRRAMTTSATEATALIARGYTELKRGDAKKSQTTQTTTEK